MDYGGGETVAWVFGSGGALALAGSGLKWLFSRRESRLTRLERKFDQVNAKVVMIGGALAEALAELRGHAPQSPNLARYERVLRIAFPVERTVPLDLAALVEKLDERIER